MRFLKNTRFYSPIFFGIVAALLALLLFERLADEMLEGETSQFDTAVRAVVHSWASPFLTGLMRLLSDIGDITAVLTLSLLTCAILWIRRRRPAAILLATSLSGAVGLMWVLKMLFHRTRPIPYFGIPVPADYSFPSGHALVAFCFYGVLAAMATSELNSRKWRILVWLVAAAMAFAIGLSRIYLGVHYPSDVIAGYLAGAIWISAVATVYRNFRPVQPRSQTPQLFV